MKKLTEKRLHKIVEEELSRLAEGDVVSDFDKFIFDGGADAAGPQGPDEFMYDGYFVSTDRMGGMAFFVSLFRGKNDSDPVASAKIENGNVYIEKGPPGMKRMPGSPDMKYRSPKQVLDALIDSV